MSRAQLRPARPKKETRSCGGGPGGNPVRGWADGLARPNHLPDLRRGGVVVVGDCMGSSERPGTVQSRVPIDSSQQGATLRQRRSSR